MVVRVVNRVRLPIVVAAAFLLSTNESRAQNQSLFGNRGPQSQSGLGAGSGSGISGPGQSDLINNLGTTTAFSEGFVGRSDNAGRFVGNQTVGQQTTATRGAGQFNRLGATAGGRGRQQFTPGPANTKRRVIRPRQRIAFDYSKPKAEAVGSALRARWQDISARGDKLGTVRFEVVEAGVVVLSGTVESERAGRLAAALARFEPGVRAVRNELTVEVSSPRK